MKKKDKLVILFLMILSIITLVACAYNEGEIKEGNEKDLYELYPTRAIIDKHNENGTYYSGMLSFVKIGDSFGISKTNEDAADYFMTEIKTLFGERVLVKIFVNYKEQSNGVFNYEFSLGFDEMINEVQIDPENKRMELDMYIYVFDKIDTRREEEERQRQIFDFVQYLKKEGLYDYLELGVSFVDERVLAPGYREEYRRKIFLSPGRNYEIDGKTASLPQMELREEMSKNLHKELIRMSEEELLENMNGIRDYSFFWRNSEQCYTWVCSANKLKLDYEDLYEEYKEKNLLELFTYEKLNNIRIVENYNYFFLN